MAGSGWIVHGEVPVLDGDASDGIPVVLYDSGSTTVRTLLATEFLVVTDVFLLSETGGDIYLVADSKAAGRYVMFAALAANGGVSKEFKIPYRCPKGYGLKLYGIATGIDQVTIQGRIDT